MMKFTKAKTHKTLPICSPDECVQNEHGDQICEAIRMIGSTDDQSICYIMQLCEAYITAQDSDGRSALHTAVLVGKSRLVHFLVTHGADVNLKDKLGSQTPLHIAVLAKNIRIISILLKYGADVTIADKWGNTPLRYIIEQQPVKILGSKFPILHGYSWGLNANYNLGLAHAQTRKVPEYVELPLERGNVLRSVSMNKYHTIFLTSFGEILSCGHGTGGRLGLGNDTSVIEPKYVEFEKRSIEMVSTGVDHTMFLTTNNEVLCCGCNNYYQLGIIPPPPLGYINSPQILREWHIKNAKVKVIGVVAAAYHSVIWSKDEVFTFGLNAGQIGHPKNCKEVFIDFPRTIDYIKKLRQDRLWEITNVVVSDGATVVATTQGDVIACYDYKIYFIPLKVQSLKKVTCIGGSLDSSIGVQLNSDYKYTNLKISILLSSGILFVWEEKASHRRHFDIWQICDIFDFCINNSGLTLVDVYGEVFYGNFGDEIVVPKEKLFEFNHYQYFYNKAAQCVKNIEKRERIPTLYRTHKIFSDPKGNNFIALQYDPRLFVTYNSFYLLNSLRIDIAELYANPVKLLKYYDTDIYVGSQCFSAHSYILAYNSEFLHEKLKQCRKKSNGLEKLKIDLDVDPDVFKEILSLIYYNHYYDGLFHKRDRFVLQFPEGKKSNQNWEMNYVHLRQKDGKIIEYIKKPSSRDPKNYVEKKCNEENIIYPLKPVTNISCYLKMKDLQDLLLLVNNYDYENQGKNENVKLHEIYAPYRIYSRTKCKEFYDLSFICTDEKFVNAHKCVVAARSHYFEAFMEFEWYKNDGNNNTLNISVSSKMLIPILDFLYTNNSPRISESRDVDFLLDILELAHLFLMKDLQQLCEISISKCLTLKNCIDLLNFSLIYEATTLKNVILEFICLNLPYYFDNRLKGLSEDVISLINEVYNRMLQQTSGKYKEFPFLPEVDYEKKIMEFNYNDYLIDNGAPDDVAEYNDYYYISKGTVSKYPLVATTVNKSTFLPTIEDLDLAFQANMTISSETPEDWLTERNLNSNESKSSVDNLQTLSTSTEKRRHKKRDRRSSSSSSQISNDSNSESENVNNVSHESFSFDDLEEREPKPNDDLNSNELKSSVDNLQTLSTSAEKRKHKRRDRRSSSSSSQISNDSNSESENVNNVSHESFSFDDLEEREPKPNDEPEWRVVGRNKPNLANDKNIESNPENQNKQQQQQQQQQHSQEDFPFFDDSPFPTLDEALKRPINHKEESPQSRRMPKFPVKSRKKSQKEESEKSTEEQKLASSPPCAWGFGSPEKSSFMDIMKSDSVASSGNSPKVPWYVKNSSPQTKYNNFGDFIYSSSGQPMKKRMSEEELCHWNPVTNSVVESPRDTGDVSLSSIMQEEIVYTKQLELQKNKSLSLIQLEEKAIKELLEYYGGEFNPEERITVNRCGVCPVEPSWEVQPKRLDSLKIKSFSQS